MYLAENNSTRVGMLGYEPLPRCKRKVARDGLTYEETRIKSTVEIPDKFRSDANEGWRGPVQRYAATALAKLLAYQQAMRPSKIAK